MKVLKYAVNKAPELIEIENGLEAMQSEVDGYIETVTFEGDAFSDVTVEAALWAIKHIEQYRYE